jgi:hypothetical protein
LGEVQRWCDMGTRFRPDLHQARMSDKPQSHDQAALRSSARGDAHN